MNDTTGVYRMNPAEDRLVYGDELTEGMWALPDNPEMRRPRGDDEDAWLRGQRFRRVTGLRHRPPCGSLPASVIFIGEWVDGYREVHSCAVNWGWIVKKDERGERQATPVSSPPE
jgi:hypothetical protein